MDCDCGTPWDGGTPQILCAKNGVFCPSGTFAAFAYRDPEPVNTGPNNTWPTPQLQFLCKSCMLTSMHVLYSFAKYGTSRLECDA